MHLSLQTDYAIRVVLYLAMNNGRGDKAAMGRAMVLHDFQLESVLPALVDYGILTDAEDALELNDDYNKFSVYDIVLAVDGEIAINRCLAPDHFCSMDATSDCLVRKFYEELQTHIVDRLKSQRIVDMIAE